MRLLLPFLVIIWWVGAWGLIDLWVEKYTREEKIRVYVAMVASVMIIVLFYPKLVRHL
jgi:hypothetical protein